MLLLRSALQPLQTEAQAFITVHNAHECERALSDHTHVQEMDATCGACEQPQLHVGRLAPIMRV